MRCWVNTDGNEDDIPFHPVVQYETFRNMTDFDNIKKQSNGKGDLRVFRKWLKKGAVDQETRSVVNEKSVENSQQMGLMVEATSHEELKQTEPSNKDRINFDESMDKPN
jgi:hypothetical protein